MAGPVPDVPDVKVIHGGALTTVQLHDASTPPSTMAPVPAVFGTFTLEGVSVAPKHGLAAWVAVKALPATVNGALRSAPVFAAAVTPNEVLPTPEVVIVIHAGLLVTVHVQPEGAVTETVDVPPPGANDALAGEIVGVGMQGSPAWLNCSVLPPMTTVALRGTPVFGAKA